MSNHIEMSNALLNRRREMMQVVKGYSVDWYPIIQGDVTTEQMIEELGNLFKTYDIAPATMEDSSHNILPKLGAKALRRDITSVQIGGNNTGYIIIYEEGYEPRLYYHFSETTVTFNSQATYKHIVFYNTAETGYNGFNATVWQIGGLWHIDNSPIKYLHIPKYSTNAINVNQFYKPNPKGYAGSIYFIPDWWSGTIYFIRYTKFSKIRFSKGCTLNNNINNNIYFMGTGQSENRALRDIYCHWGLGEVKQQGYNREVYRNVKLHIPDLGNAEDNAALVSEYRSKGWNYLSGAGIYNDVETTEPEEQTTI